MRHPSGVGSIVGGVNEPSDDTTGNTDATVEPVDLAGVSADLDGVEAALRRLDEGTYWTDEVTGDEIPDEVLAADPVTRRADGR